MPAPSRALLLYAGSCGPCATFARWVEMADLERRIRTRTLEDPEVETRYRRRLGPRYGEAFHLDSGGRVSTGAEALPELLGLLPGGRLWGPLARLPPARAVLAWGYGRLARLHASCP